MKMMKKILVLAMVLVASLCFMACGAKETEETKEPEQQDDLVTETEENTEEKDGLEEEPSETETPDADIKELPAGATRIPIPSLTDEGMNYVAIGYHGNTDASLSELSIGELEGFEGNAVKTRMKQLADEPFWIFGIDLSEAEGSPCMDPNTFTNLKKITFDYTSTEDYTSEIFDGDLLLQLVWKNYEEVKGVQMENTALTAEFDIKFEKTDEITTFTIDFENDYPEFAQTLAQAIIDYDTLHLDFLQFGFHNGLSFDDDNPFTPFNAKFGNLTFYCE